jgi:hypothetical protein
LSAWITFASDSTVGRLFSKSPPVVLVDIANSKTAAIAAWVHLAPEQVEVQSRAATAEILGVSRQSVSNYLNDVRYKHSD